MHAHSYGSTMPIVASNNSSGSSGNEDWDLVDFYDNIATYLSGHLLMMRGKSPTLILPRHLHQNQNQNQSLRLVQSLHHQLILHLHQRHTAALISPLTLLRQSLLLRPLQSLRLSLLSSSLPSDTRQTSSPAMHR